MSTNYTQYCIVGKKFDLKTLKVVDSPKVTERQPRYDTRTGNIIKYETVVVKQEVYHYELFNEFFQDEFDLEESFIQKGYDVVRIYNNIYIGIDIGKKENIDYLTLVTDNISLEKITETFQQAREMLNGLTPELYFFYEVT